MTVGVLGANGYTGEFLCKKLFTHPNIKTLYFSSRSLEGKNIQKHTPFVVSTSNTENLASPFYISTEELLSLCEKKKIDVLFSALPHTESARICKKVCEENKDLVFIDLSADFRFRDVSIYNKTYKTQHPSEQLLKYSVYGLSEWNREHIKKARIIACPGCYVTSVLLPLLPIVRNCTPNFAINIVSSSGISGAGKKVDPHTRFSDRFASVLPYSVGNKHRHLEEMYYYIKHFTPEKNPNTDLIFIPQLVPIRQGIVSIITIPLEKTDIPRAIEVLKSQYIAEPWVLVEEREDIMPDVTQTVDTNYALIGYTRTKQTLIVCCVIDNLGKGAAGQAIQNFNIRYNFESTAGL